MTRAGSPVTLVLARDLLSSVATDVGSVVEARWIMAHAAGVTPSDLLTRLDTEVAPELSRAVHAMADRCVAGEPLQYVLGTWAFRSLELRVDPRVLIPRPETEQVAAVALDELAVQARRVTDGARLFVADLGAGSGAIALSLAVEFEPELAPGLARPATIEVWATDASSGALEVLGENLTVLARDHPHAAARVRTAEGSWFDALPGALAGHLALIVSNPPYVSEAEWEDLAPVVRDHEPKAALVPGVTGLEAIERLLHDAPRWLAPGGSLVVELAPGQAESAQKRAIELGYEEPEVRHDLAGRRRILVARRPD